MPLGSIAEWRARIGSSWCALSRSFKTRSPFRHSGAGRLQTPLTLNQVVTMIMILIIFTAINLSVRIVWTTGHYRAYLGEYPLAWENSNCHEKLYQLPEINSLLCSGLAVSWMLHNSKIIGLLMYQSLLRIITCDTLPWLLGITIALL